ncbi:MAG: D-aminoacylase [Chloroflexi bacterium]|nr:D-aminoacylase [Chloroflexota bacterium]
MDFDLLIRGGTVVDGSGNPAFTAGVGVRGDRIAAVGTLPDDATGATEIDATDRIVAPGFIDAHPHSETALRGNGEIWGAVLQGVTAHLTGPDGFGWAPLPADKSAELWRSTAFAYGQPDLRPEWATIDDYLGGFSGTIPLNVVPMAPHQPIRFAVMGWDVRPPTPAEMDRMRALTRDWMEAGAVGLNTGLDYQPAANADTAELIELAKVVREYDGVYAAHIRYNKIGSPAAYRESIEIGRRADIPIRQSHESVDDVTEPLLEEARAAGVDFGIDWYLYPAGSSHLPVLLPPEDQIGGFDAMVKRLLEEPDFRKRIARFLEDKLAESAATGGREYFSETRSGQHIGRSIAEIAADRGAGIGETAVDLIIEESPEAVLVFRRGTSGDALDDLLRRTLAHPAFMVASDGLYHGAMPHPRGYGCFAQVLGTYVRERGFVSLERAVHLMSGLPALRFGIRDRGRIVEGLGADLVLFDPASVGAGATFDEPRRPAVGIDAVIVNGVVVARNGRPTAARPGTVLRTGRHL